MIVNKLDTKLLQIEDDIEVDAIIYLQDSSRIGYISSKIDIVHNYPFINACGARGNITKFKELSYISYISYISLSPTIKAIPNLVSTLSVEEIINKNETTNAISNINYLSVNSNAFTVAIIDTGINSHIDLCIGRKHIKKFVEFDKENTVNYDDNGHGTFVAGVISGNGIASAGKVKGISPNTDVIGLKVMNEKGEGNALDVLRSMEWILNNKEKFNIKIVCCSFGCQPSAQNDPLVLGVEALVDNGLIVVCAVGNGGELEGVLSPAISPKVISVGAVDKDYQIAPFSAYTKSLQYLKPEIYACGVDVAGLSNNGIYCSMSGTSVSAPIVCGWCANILEQYPDLTPFEVKQQLLRMSKKYNGKYII